MAIQATRAAKALKNNQGAISSHELISLLMAGGLERIQQAKQSLSKGEDDDAEILLRKTVDIIKGLQNSLNFESGGDIAANLDSLYHYMIGRITENEAADPVAAVEEVGKLLSEVKVGWDKMDVRAIDIAS